MYYVLCFAFVGKSNFKEKEARSRFFLLKTLILMVSIIYSTQAKLIWFPPSAANIKIVNNL